MDSKTSIYRHFFETLFAALKKSRRDYAKDMSASIAFFTFFSLFPLLLGLIASAGFFINPEDLSVYLDRLLFDELPGSGSFVRENIDAVVRLRGAAGTVGILGLLWPAQKMAGAVSRSINRALDQDKGPPAILSRLRYFLITLSIPVLLLLMMGVLTLIELLITLGLGPSFGFFTKFE